MPKPDDKKPLLEFVRVSSNALFEVRKIFYTEMKGQQVTGRTEYLGKIYFVQLTKRYIFSSKAYCTLGEAELTELLDKIKDMNKKVNS